MKQYTVEFMVRAIINTKGHSDEDDDNEFTNDLADYEIQAMITMPDIIDVETIEYDSD
jgi:hypothetical protein